MLGYSGRRQLTFCLLADDDNVDLSLRNSDSENDNEELSEQEEKRRLERLEREKWIQGKSFDICPWRILSI